MLARVLAILAMAGTAAFGAIGTVWLMNASYENTQIEVNDWVEILIQNATPGGTVSSVINGNSYTWPTKVNSSGTWSVVTQETSQYAGNWTENWYVNGIQMTPFIPSPVWLPWAPTLPNFTVYQRFSGSNCPGPSSNSSNQCPANSANPSYSTLPAHWIWTPVEYDMQATGVSASAASNAASLWNATQNALTLTTSVDWDDIVISDVASTPNNAYGVTYAYGQNCTACFDLVDQCTGACSNSAAVWYVTIGLNDAQIAGFEAYTGVPATAWGNYLHRLLSRYSTQIVFHLGRRSSRGFVRKPMCGLIQARVS